MAQIFHRSTNTLSKLSIFGALFFIAALVWLLLALQRSSYVTEVNVARDQPVPFSHAHHVGSIGIDCRYCHTSVETSSFAGIPSTETCMNCHSQIWADSPMLEPVRESFRTGKPLRWARVYRIAEFAYFDHSIHVAKGIGCVTCHGRVDRMPLTWRTVSLQMEWCLDCHRDPSRFVRPRERVFSMSWEGAVDSDRRTNLMMEYGIDRALYRLTDCSTCHR